MRRRHFRRTPRGGRPRPRWRGPEALWISGARRAPFGRALRSITPRYGLGLRCLGFEAPVIASHHAKKVRTHVAPPPKVCSVIARKPSLWMQPEHETAYNVAKPSESDRPSIRRLCRTATPSLLGPRLSGYPTVSSTRLQVGHPPGGDDGQAWARFPKD